MYVDPDYFHLMRWRYLDCFDSIRYSQKEFVTFGTPYQFRVKQASNEFLVALLMGNGICVPNNQLLDSKGFIKIASGLLKVASDYKRSGKKVFVPLSFAVFNYGVDEIGNDPYKLASYIFNKDGTESKGYFELSAWPEIDKDFKRRQEWAKAFQNRIMVDETFIQPNEVSFLVDLLRILNYFAENRGMIIEAASTKNIREKMTLSISCLFNKSIKEEVFFEKDVNMKNDIDIEEKTKKINDIVKIFKKIEENGILDNRSSIRENLTSKMEYFEGIDGIDNDIEQLRIGVLKTFNSIYNYSGYKSTKVKQDSQTEMMDLDDIWNYDEAAFALGQYAREKYEESIKGKNAINDISSLQNSYIGSDVSELVSAPDENEEIWGGFFEYQRSELWNTSLLNYARSLNNFEKAKNQYDRLAQSEKTITGLRKVLEKAKMYSEYRIKHIELVNSILPEENKIKFDSEGIAFLERRDEQGKTISKIQIENFAEFPEFTKREIGQLFALEPFLNVTIKGRSAEYGEDK